MNTNTTNEGVMNNISHPSKKTKNITELLHQLLNLKIDHQILINEISNENCDMEQYEGTQVEDLVHSHYINGKMDMLIEVKDLLMDRL